MTRQLKRTVFVAIAATLSSLSIAGVAQSVKTRHVRDVIQKSEVAPNGRLPQSQELQLDLVLPLRDPAGLKSFLADVYNPKSPNYQHFITPPEFTARFGPTQEQYDEVLRFARASDLRVVGGSRERMEVQVKGTVGAIEAALHVSLNTYPHPKENRTFYGVDREPTPNLSFSLWHISGLDNFSIPRPLFVKKTDFAASHGIYPEQVVSHATTGSGPSASFLGSDMRGAYATGTSLTGSGQVLGLVEFLGTDLADLNTYYANVHQTNSVPVNLISTDGSPTSCTYPSCDDTEQTLDMTQALGVAPALKEVDMYISLNNDVAIISAMTTHNPLPTTIGCSWGWSPTDESTLDPYFQQMAAQGQNFFAAAGDSGAWNSGSVAWPADDPLIVSVGGTDLTTSSAGGPWSGESAWVDGGGGINPDGIAIPSWQAQAGVINSSNGGSTTLRNGPDVSANANFTFYVCADQSGCTANLYGGTSFAAPMWAGFIALVNQQRASNGLGPLGFLNPTIYNQNVTSVYTTNFHDIVSGSNGFSAVTGYDLATGWGSPKPALIPALAGGGSAGGFTLSASPTSISISQGGSGNSTITSTVSGGFNSAVALSASGQPSGVTVGFSPTSITGTGSSTMNITVGSSTATGTYTITVTGTGGGQTNTTTVGLTVTAAGFSLSASPSSVTIAQGGSGSSTITSAVTGGFNSAVALSASGQPTGVTVSFNPTSITGNGSSTMGITVASSTVAGTYTITVTGTGGGQTHTTTVRLTVTATGFSLSASPSSVTIAQGGSGSSTVTSAVTGGFNSAVALSASGQPTGVTVSFNPTSITGNGSSTMGITVASSTVAGTYTITVTGTGGGQTHTTTVTLTVTGTTASFSLRSSPSSISIARGSAANVTITSTVTGGFNSPVSLSASGVGRSNHVTFVPTSITGTGSSTMTISIGTTARTGTRTITVTGTSNGTSHSTTVTVTIH